ncbi:MAG: hypothetical protein KKF48_01535 [Nanoarchaeota archaeon]|nr:hypothetical protein [Nanoarchaeota archaeon]MBU1027704.1 hypothetical protein [Nanoarchaeota archaeon]
MTNDQDKWYSSNLGHGIGIGIGAFGIFVGIGSCSYLLDIGAAKREEEKAKHPVIQQQDLNYNQLSETFVEINKVRYFSTIDGKLLQDNLKK